MKTCALAILLAFASLVQAAPLRLFVEMDDGKVQTADVSIADARGFTISLPGGDGTMLIPMDRVKTWRLAPPKPWSDAEKELQAGRSEKALPPMRDYTDSLLPLLSIPKGDAASYVFKYADLLRSRGDYKGAIELLAKIPADTLGETRAQSIVVTAYCRAMLGEVDAAETQLNTLRAPTRRSSLFSLYKLTRARIAAARKDLVTALDEIASVIAHKRLGSDSYAEALYLSAEAYDELGRVILKQKEAIQADDKLRRLYEQSRGEAFDALGMIQSDKSSVSAIMDDPPDLPGVSIEIRKQLVRVFPTSPWSSLARAKLPPGALDKVATAAPEPQGAAPSGTPNPTPTPTPNPTPGPTPDDGLINTETPASKLENL
ncbi:MAG: hypothetical protein WEB60_00515 [Terrimicrobiaceae bacterium]